MSQQLVEDRTFSVESVAAAWPQPSQETGEVYDSQRASPSQVSVRNVPSNTASAHTLGNSFVGEWDEEGVFFYQAFNDDIADFAVLHQRFGGPSFNPQRMTWIKPSFAWMLYRSGYGHKDRNQCRILKIKLSHDVVAEILSRCRSGHGNGGGEGRVQWDPGRSLLTASHSGRSGEPAQAGGRAIQIGMKGNLSCYYVTQILSIQDVTSLAHDVQRVHGLDPDECEARIVEMLASGHLPHERPYAPQCSPDILRHLNLRGNDDDSDAESSESKAKKKGKSSKAEGKKKERQR